VNQLDAFLEKFRVEELLLSESEHWRWSLRPVQCTLGASVLSLRRLCPEFSGVTAEEASDLPVLVRQIEDATRSAFAYEKINYLALMMIDPHFHFHVIPRYSSSRDFGGAVWEDKPWPAPPVLRAELTGDDLLKKIRDELARHIYR
jgi:diadenosine tetraphosphate (Ap4A) HIT family hydrolase